MDIFDVITAWMMWNAFGETEETNEKFDEKKAKEFGIKLEKEPNCTHDDICKNSVNKETKPVHKTETKEPKNVNTVDISKKNDAVNHPSHYTDGKYEVIDFIEQYGLPYHLGNAVKYISRAGKKDPDKYIEDLEKALWYIHRWNEKENPEDYAYRRIASSRNVRNRIKYSDYVEDKDLPVQLGQVIFGCISYDDLNGSIKRAERILRKYISELKLEQEYLKMRKEQAKDILSGFENI